MSDAKCKDRINQTKRKIIKNICEKFKNNDKQNNIKKTIASTTRNENENCVYERNSWEKERQEENEDSARPGPATEAPTLHKFPFALYHTSIVHQMEIVIQRCWNFLHFWYVNFDVCCWNLFVLVYLLDEKRSEKEDKQKSGARGKEKKIGMKSKWELKIKMINIKTCKDIVQSYY